MPKRTLSGMHDEEMEDISPESVLVGELFLKELSRNGIEDVKLVPFSAKGRNNPEIKAKHRNRIGKSSEERLLLLLINI